MYGGGTKRNLNEDTLTSMLSFRLQFYVALHYLGENLVSVYLRMIYDISHDRRIMRTYNPPSQFLHGLRTRRWRLELVVGSKSSRTSTNNAHLDQLIPATFTREAFKLNPKARNIEPAKSYPAQFWNYGIVIVDEFHECKSKGTSAIRALMKISEQNPRPYIWAMSRSTLEKW